MFCVECGKEIPIFKEGVCIDCYINSHTFTKGPEIIDITVCSHCGSFKYKNTWTNEALGEILIRFIKNNFQISNELKKLDINTECSEAKGGYQCKVYITGFLDDREITEDHEILVRIKTTVCDVCSKRFGGYHEAIVQVRTENKKLSDDEAKEITELVENMVEELFEKGNRSLFITDMGEESSGLDFYISEKGPALAIAKKIQEQYGGAIKQSSKNIGMKDGKQLYRMTYSIRLPFQKKGTFLEHNKTIFYVLSIHGNKIKMINLVNWEEFSLTLKDVENAKMLGGEELIIKMILVSQTDDEVQVMDPDNYKIQIIKKPKPIIFKTEKIKILKTENHNLLIPNNYGR
jgi:nonsense-mediated mRNA decay protein 3